MNLKYVFGPAAVDTFAAQKLPKACAANLCHPFSLEQVRTADSWDAFAASLPGDFRPDFVALDLQYQSLPPWLMNAPLPVVGLAGDGALLWHGVRRLNVDLVLCDSPTAERLRKEGVAQARPAILYGVERAFLEHGPLDGPRDIQILFAGNLHPACQAERLPWLLRMARLGKRWNVVISGAWHDEYRSLLRRSRVVFNRSTRSEWNRRNGECIGSKSLLFCERGNAEVTPLLRDRQECVYYDDTDLEQLLEHYLTHEDERQAVAEAAHARREEFSFEAFWQTAMATVAAEWPLIQERCGRRREAGPPSDPVPELLARTWRAASSAGDPLLHGDLLNARAAHPGRADVHNALGLAAGLLAQPGRITAEAARQAAVHFNEALRHDPRHLVAGLNLVEALTGVDQKAAAIDGARQLLAGLDRGAGDDATLIDAPRFPPCFDLMRVEWEKAGWDHPGDAKAEARRKRDLVRWRLHWLLAELTGDAGHLHEAVAVLPDAPLSRAALGCALGQAGNPHLAAGHLRRAVAAVPFDFQAARALYQALTDTQQGEEAARVAEDCRLLHRAAPGAVREEPWFAVTVSGGLKLRTITAAQFDDHFGNPDTARALCAFTPAHDTHVVLALVAHLKPRRVVEIGTAAGHMTANLTEWSPDDATVFTLGVTSDMHGASKSEQEYEAPPREALGKFSDHFGKGAKVLSITADSSKYDFRRIGPIDFAFIDGAHDLEHVLADTLNVYRELAPGGCIAWHDFNSPTAWVEVRQALEKANLPEPVVHVEGTEVAFLLKARSAERGEGSAERGAQSVNGHGAPRAALCAPLAVAWEGAFRGVHSLALVNRELCVRLAGRGVELGLAAREFHPQMGVPESPLPGELSRRLGKALPRPADVTVRHQWPPDLRPPSSGHWVMMQPWEFGALPRAWLAAFSQQADEVWVPTQYVKDGFVQSGVPADRVAVVPLGVDVHTFRPEARRLLLKTQKKFRFLFVGGTIWRKGFDVLLDAYAAAFTQADDVCLVVKEMGRGTFYKGQTAEQRIADLRAVPFAPEVEYIDQSFDPDQLAGLYTACDCLTHPYRGEGFGLPIAEAMACGLPVVIPNAGAALDYCDERNAYLVASRILHLREKKIGDEETVGTPYFAEPDRDALARVLRHVRAYPDEARAKGAAGCARVRAQLTWDHAAAAVEARLRAIVSRPVRRQSHGGPAPSTNGHNRRRMRVSLCMIVKNEEGNLAACLGSVIDLVDEVIIVDTGSTDRTKEIAAGFGAKVKIHDFPWVDSFAAARNEALRHATGDHIFWADGDDVLDELNRDRLRALFARLGDDDTAYSMKCLCLPEPGGTPTVVDHVRLFRNRPDVRWKYRVHEQILPSVRRRGGQVEFSDVVVCHTGYQDPKLRGRKLQRDLRLLLLNDAEEPGEPFVQFNLGCVYQELGRHDQALGCLRRSLERSAPTDSIVRKSYALVAGSLKALGRRQEAVAACRDGLAAAPGDAELLFRAGVVLRELGSLPEAEAAFLELLSSAPGLHFASVDPTLRGWRGRHELAEVLYQRGRRDDARAQWREVVRECAGVAAAWLRLAEIALGTGDLDGVEDVARHLDGLGCDADAGVLRGRALLARGQLDAARALAQDLIGRHPRALHPRQLLAEALTTDGRDLPAIEQALRDVLLLDPGHKQTQAVLAQQLRRRLRTEDALFEAMGAVTGWVLGQRFQAACVAGAELSEHLVTLCDLARECKHVIDLGTGGGQAALAFLWAQPDRLVCVDVARHPEVDHLEALAGRTRVEFRREDVLAADLEETDLLFLDMPHDGPQLRAELARHAGRARKYVVLHGTAAFAEAGETPGQPGVGPVVEEFLASGSFTVKQRWDNNGGLTVLERVSGDGGHGG